MIMLTWRMIYKRVDSRFITLLILRRNEEKWVKKLANNIIIKPLQCYSLCSNVGKSGHWLLMVDEISGNFNFLVLFHIFHILFLQLTEEKFIFLGSTSPQWNRIREDEDWLFQALQWVLCILQWFVSQCSNTNCQRHLWEMVFQPLAWMLSLPISIAFSLLGQVISIELYLDNELKSVFHGPLKWYDSIQAFGETCHHQPMLSSSCDNLSRTPRCEYLIENQAKRWPYYLSSKLGYIWEWKEASVAYNTGSPGKQRYLATLWQVEFALYGVYRYPSDHVLSMFPASTGCMCVPEKHHHTEEYNNQREISQWQSLNTKSTQLQ